MALMGRIPVPSGREWLARAGLAEALMGRSAVDKSELLVIS